jgi:hypothetical protein
MATKTEVAAAVAFMFASFNREANEMHVEAWWIALQRFEALEINQACVQLVSTAETLPPVGAVIRHIKSQRAEEARRNTKIRRNQQIALEANAFRQRNPQATAGQVAEYITEIEQRLMK